MKSKSRLKKKKKFFLNRNNESNQLTVVDRIGQSSKLCGYVLKSLGGFLVVAELYFRGVNAHDSTVGLGETVVVGFARCSVALFAHY